MSNVSAEPSVFLVNTAGDATSIRSETSLKIGRDSDNDLSISDNSVSRHHAVITLTDGVVRLQDLGSSNGTYTNDLRVIEALLKDGDSLRFGSARFSFHHAEHPNFEATGEHEAPLSNNREPATWWQRAQSVMRKSVRSSIKAEVKVPPSPEVFRVLARCSCSPSAQVGQNGVIEQERGLSSS
jgi:predicted component of type VI protein secretion system